MIRERFQRLWLWLKDQGRHEHEPIMGVVRGALREARNVDRAWSAWQADPTDERFTTLERHMRGLHERLCALDTMTRERSYDRHEP